MRSSVVALKRILERSALAALVALAVMAAPVRAADPAAVRIEVAVSRHGTFVDAVAAVTNEDAGRIDALAITCTILSREHRPLDIQDGYLIEIATGATAYTRLLFVVPLSATLGRVACRPLDMLPRIARSARGGEGRLG